MLVSKCRSVARGRGQRRRPRGFTLVELAVTIAVLAILSTLAAPSFRAFIGTMRAKSAAFDLINDLSIARSEAIKGNQMTSITPVGGNWSNGWQVLDGNGALLRERAAMGSSLSISVAPAGGLSFLPNGRTPNDNAPGNLAWSITSSIAGVTARCVVVSPSGSARSKMGGC
jgi:type IV fimbrial biogenesis protein FimT